jgi:hypothetical protein
LHLGLRLSRLAAALLSRARPAAPVSVVAISGDETNLALLRRTVPALRSRRPTATIEAQERWRHAAGLRRSLRIVS